MSAADMIRYHCHPHIADDQPSSSSVSFDSSTSSSESGANINTNTTITAMPTLTNRNNRSHKRLLRKIRRLRSENTALHNNINILKEDLRHERESRQIAEQCHRKFFDDSMDTHTRLNLEIMDQQDQLLAYESRFSETADRLSTSVTNRSGDFDGDGDYLLWGCEDMDYNKERRCHGDDDDGNHNNFDMRGNDDQYSMYQQSDCSNDDEYNNNNNNNDDHPFEDLAISYLRQALISNLTSARAHLELDDLILKHDPSPERVLRTLADAFFGWIRDTIVQVQRNNTSAGATTTGSATPTTTTVPNTFCTTIKINPTDSNDDKAMCVARLISTLVQDVFLHFWKNILERYVHNDEDQYQFLQQAERTLHQQQQNESYGLVANFHRLLIMLYKYDIVDGEAVVRWWHGYLPHSLDNDDDGDNFDDTVASQLRDVTRKFVEWVDDDDGDDDNDNDHGAGKNSDDEEDLFTYDSDLNYDIDDDEDDNYCESDNEDDEFLVELMGLTPVDDSNVSRTPIQPVDKKKKSVTIQV